MSPIYNIDLLSQLSAQVRTKIPEAVLILRDYNTNQVYKEKIITMIDHLNLATPWFGWVCWNRGNKQRFISRS